MRIAVIGDLHVGLYSRPSRLRTIFETAKAQKPEVVLLAGDLVDDDPVYAPKLLRDIDALKPTTPILGVLGNHEMYGDPLEMIGRLRGSRVHLLVNEGIPMRGLWIAGLSDYAARTPQLAPNLDAALAQRGNALPIVLAHQPRAFPDAIKRAVPLTLCAHSHRGQCGIRPLRWTLACLFIPYHIGLYQRGASQLYVHTGAGYWLLPWRLGISPEIVIVEMRRRGAPPAGGSSPREDELEAAIAPLLWGSVAAGVALAAIAATVLLRGTQRVDVPHERA